MIGAFLETLGITIALWIVSDYTNHQILYIEYSQNRVWLLFYATFSVINWEKVYFQFYAQNICEKTKAIKGFQAQYNLLIIWNNTLEILLDDLCHNAIAVLLILLQCGVTFPIVRG